MLLIGASCTYRGGIPENAVLSETTAVIRGDLGYPSDWVPPMVIYAENVRTGEVFTARTQSSPSILSYAIEVSAPGEYEVYAWTIRGYMTDESLGSYHFGGSVAGGEPEVDMSMRRVCVDCGQTVEGVDIYHFGDLPERVPRPPAM